VFDVLTVGAIVAFTGAVNNAVAVVFADVNDDAVDVASVADV